jgi:hypothetical protein
VNDELVRIWKEAVVAIRLEILRKKTKYFRQDNRSWGRNMNSGPPRYEAGVLTTRPIFED